MFCPQCGSRNQDEAKFCKMCGTSLIRFQPATPTTAKVPAPAPPADPQPESAPAVAAVMPSVSEPVPAPAKPVPTPTTVDTTTEPDSDPTPAEPEAERIVRESPQDLKVRILCIVCGPLYSIAALCLLQQGKLKDSALFLLLLLAYGIWLTVGFFTRGWRLVIY